MSEMHTEARSILYLLNPTPSLPKKIIQGASSMPWLPSSECEQLSQPSSPLTTVVRSTSLGISPCPVATTIHRDGLPREGGSLTSSTSAEARRGCHYTSTTPREAFGKRERSPICTPGTSQSVPMVRMIYHCQTKMLLSKYKAVIC